MLRPYLPSFDGVDCFDLLRRREKERAVLTVLA